MDDLFKDDSTFELFTGSDNSGLFQNRVLTTYPSEKNSFQVDLGFDGEKQSSKTDSKREKAEYDPEKLAQGVTATAGAISSVATTVQAFKGEDSTSKKKELKQVCGRKPLLKKNRVEYDKCVANYNASKTSYSNDTKTVEQTNEAPETNTYNKKMIIGAVVVVAVVVTAIFAYKKGWFTKKSK